MLLEDDWSFYLGDSGEAYSISFDDSDWETVSIPHDWAVRGPFDRSVDLQKVTVSQNFETVETWKTGRSGGLPYIGTGRYRRTFDVPQGMDAILLFDGAMSEARVYVNGKEKNTISNPDYKSAQSDFVYL